MTAHRICPHRTLMYAALVGIVSTMLMASGCVSTSTHERTLEELQKAKNLSASQAAELEALRKKSKAESDELQQQLAGLKGNLDQETSQRKTAEQQAASLEKERDALTTRSTELQNRLDGLERDKSQLGNELGDVRSQIAALEKKLSDETAHVSALENDKQQLASGTADAQSEIVKLQQRAAELEAESARVAKEREQLRQEQSRLSATLDQERQRLKAEGEEKARLASEREQLQQQQSQLSATLDQERQRQSQLSASLDEERKRLKAEGEEKARLEREHAAKEDEIRRLTKTQEELSRSLKDEIDKGNITIQQVRDRLTINMVDRVLFDSGRAVIKPAGLKVLKQVSDVLNKVTDKQIRIEGHTDNVPISTKLQDKFKTNWELSTARATTVVRYLIDQGGVQPQALSAVGYADTRPIAGNESEEGRSSNRRIEIVLYPKDLSQIAGGLSSGN